MNCIIHIFMPQGAYLVVPFDIKHPLDVAACVETALQQMLIDNPGFSLRDIRLEISFA